MALKQIILDTSFILTCVRQKIDFFNEIFEIGGEALIPDRVIAELEKIAKGKTKRARDAQLALRILLAHNFKKIDAKIKNTDKAIILYANSHKNVIVASLDREIKHRTKNKKMIIRGRKKLEVV